jgi:anti-sigma B factor antagonist
VNITQNQQGSISVFTLEGRADSVSGDQLEQMLRKANTFRMILDMSQLMYINSAGLRVLGAMLTENQPGGGDLLLVVPSSKVRRVFEIIGFDKFFRLFDSIDAAVREF